MHTHVSSILFLFTLHCPLLSPYSPSAVPLLHPDSSTFTFFLFVYVCVCIHISAYACVCVHMYIHVCLYTFGGLRSISGVIPQTQFTLCFETGFLTDLKLTQQAIHTKNPLVYTASTLAFQVCATIPSFLNMHFMFKT